MSSQADKWVVKVSENGLHAFNKSFRTKKLAGEYCEKMARYGSKWGFELVKL